MVRTPDFNLHIEKILKILFETDANCKMMEIHI